MEPISPILQAKIQSQNFSTPIKTQIEPNLKTSEIKPDTVEISKPKMSNKKKALLIAGGILAATAATLGIIALVHRGNIKQIQKEGEKTFKDGVEIINEVMEKLKNVEPNENGIKTLKEFSEDGSKLIRKSIMDAEENFDITDFLNKTNIHGNSAKDFSFSKGIKLTEKGKINYIEKKFDFEEAKLTLWGKGVSITKDNSIVKKMVVFNSEGYTYFKNAKVDSNYTGEIQKAIFFKDGIVIAKNIHQVTNQSQEEITAEKIFGFKNGKFVFEKGADIDLLSYFS